MDGAGPGRITVAAALELPELRRGLPAVVAGEDALDRPIRWVHAGEVPNIASLLRGGELLLTTGMGIGARAAEQGRFIAELAARRVAALVIELGGTFASRLPPALISAAERHGLPLVELHAEVPFVAVTEAIHTAIVNEHYELLRRGDDLNTRFTVLMLQGGGIPGVLSLLAEALANPVFLEGVDGRLLYYAVPPTSTVDGDPVVAWSQAAEDAESLGVTALVMGGNGQPAGRLLSLPVEASLDAFASLALERAAGIVAVAFLRTRQEDELVALGRGNLLSRLAGGRIPPALAAARAREMGFSNRPLDVLLPLVSRLLPPAGCAPSDAEATRVSAGSAWTSALRELEQELAGLGAPALVGVDPANGDLLLVLGLRDPGERAAIATRAAEVVRDVARRQAGTDAVVAAGPTGDWAAVGLGLQEAAESAAAARTLPDRVWYDASTMPLDRFLWRLRGHEDLARYVERALGPVLAHDAKRKHALMPTLEALCEHGGRKAETARALYLNRQALYDRIARLERVLGADVSDPQMLAALHLAIRAQRYTRDGGRQPHN